MHRMLLLAVSFRFFLSPFLDSECFQAPKQGGEGHRFISARQLMDKIENRERFTLIDCRPVEEFLQGHIPGAVNVSFDTYTFQEETVLKKSIREIQAEAEKEIDFILIDGSSGEPYMSISKMERLAAFLPEDRSATLIFYCRDPD